jgi:crotonobetainyl-CoA:carnitine CoA-transferase CaiB-like acyl-CoA transferase
MRMTTAFAVIAPAVTQRLPDAVQRLAHLVVAQLRLPYIEKGPRMSRRPLDGILVVSVEQAVAAPYVTRQLADLGARVIKIERPDGDFARGYDRAVGGLSSFFVWLNRGKESVCLDLKQTDDAAVLERLLARADVFVHNLAPGAMARLGFDAAALAQRHPRLIQLEVSGYGHGGPDDARRAYDLLIQAETGLLSITGTPDQPAKAGISIADIAAGMHGYAAVLAALFHRERTGRGDVIEVSLLDALGEWMSQPAYLARYAQQPQRAGARHASIAPYGPYPTADGMVLLGVQNARDWTRFCQLVLERPEIADDQRFVDNPARVAHRDQLDALISSVLRRMSTDDVLARLDRAGVAAGRMRDLTEFMAHPQLTARQRWREVDTPAGPVPALLPPAIFGSFTPQMGSVPGLGEHTAAVLAELGFSPDDPPGPPPDTPQGTGQPG